LEKSSCFVCAIPLRDIADHIGFVSHGGQKFWLVRRPTGSARLAVRSARNIEIVLGLLITIGLRTSYAAFIAGICVFRLILQTKLGLDVLGEDDYSRCLSIQAVYDENPIV
jgi:hypothetical protein